MLEWDGKELETWGEIGSVLVSIAKAKDREAAQRFTDAYVADLSERHPTEDARTLVSSNIGYLSGYYDPKTMAAIQDIFDMAHPVFGRASVGKGTSDE